MRTLLLTLPLFAATAAEARDRTPPGLERVCESVQPETTPSEVIASALRIGDGSTCDHPSYSDGKCVITRRALAVTSNHSINVALTEPLSTDTDVVDEPLYVASVFNLDEAAEWIGDPIGVSG